MKRLMLPPWKNLFEDFTELFDDELYFRHSPHFYTINKRYKIVEMSDKEVEEEDKQKRTKYYKQAIEEREHTIKLAEQELLELRKKIRE